VDVVHRGTHDASIESQQPNDPNNNGHDEDPSINEPKSPASPHSPVDTQVPPAQAGAYASEDSGALDNNDPVDIVGASEADDDNEELSKDTQV
jgi:hypothetical protein